MIKTFGKDIEGGISEALDEVRKFILSIREETGAMPVLCEIENFGPVDCERLINDFDALKVELVSLENSRKYFTYEGEQYDFSEVQSFAESVMVVRPDEYYIIDLVQRIKGVPFSLFFNPLFGADTDSDVPSGYARIYRAKGDIAFQEIPLVPPGRSIRELGLLLYSKLTENEVIKDTIKFRKAALTYKEYHGL